MTLGPSHWNDAGGESPPQAWPSIAAGADTPAGWYQDPWAGTHHRYWNGHAWTGDSFPHGPHNPAEPAPPEVASQAEWYPPPPVASETPPPPHWSPPAHQPAWTQPWPTQAPAAPPAPTKVRAGLPTGTGFIALVVAIVLVVGSLGVVGGYFVFAQRDTPSRVATGPGQPQPLPSTPADPAAAVLSGLVVTQADVDQSDTVSPIAGGTQVAGQTTLDVCNGSYPSEALRTARLQVEAVDSQSVRFLSTEAVLYQNPAATTQAFTELQATAAACPDTPVVSPVGEATVTTHINAAPDGAWPQVATVERLAFDLSATDDVGTTAHSIAVYLRRGRVLMGVYFSQPDAPTQASVAGQTTIATITNVFANRMAQLPGSVVNG